MRALQIQLVDCRRRPRQFQGKFEVAAQELVIRRHRGQPLQTRYLAFQLLAHFIRHVDSRQLFTQDVHVVLILVFSQFLLDLSELLAQHVFPLRLVEFHLRLAGDLATQAEDLYLSRQMLGDLLQQGAQVVGHQQFDFLLGVDVEDRGNQVRQLRGLHGVNQQIRHVLRNGIEVLDRLAHQLLDVAEQSGYLCRIVFGLRQRAHRDPHVLTGVDLVQELDAFNTLEDKLEHVFVALDNPLDHRQGRRGIEMFQVGRLGLGIALHGSHQELVFRKPG